MPEQLKPNLIDRVQTHERQWGTENYTGRPSLAQILSTNVVVFWQVSKGGKPQDRPIITLHDDLQEVEDWFLKFLARAHLEAPDRRFLAAYQKGKVVRIRGVKISFEVEGE